MREILFRGFYPYENGKQKVFVDGKWINGEWMEGYYILSPDETVAIFNNEGFGRVIPATVGQYTGLTDKNGRKIFEGDILKIASEAGTEYEESYLTKVIYCDGAFTVDVRYFDYDCTAVGWAIYEWEETDVEFEVIGNIYENPELLEKE